MVPSCHKSGTKRKSLGLVDSMLPKISSEKFKTQRKFKYIKRTYCVYYIIVHFNGYEVQVGTTQCGKFHEFSITQILREINPGDSRGAKSAILTHLRL